MRRLIILLYPFLTLGMTSLQFGIDARGTGMGGTGTGIGRGIGGMGYNPASLSYLREAGITFTHNEWLQNIRYEYIGWGKRLRRGIIGIGTKGVYMGKLERRTGPTPEPEGYFSAYNLETSINFAYPLFEKLSLGLGIGGVIEGIDIYHGFGFTLNGGLLYETFIPGLSVGLSGVNIGPKFKLNTKKCKPKSQLRGGLSFKRGPLLLAMDIVKDLYGDFSFHTGGEYQIGNFSLGCGYIWEKDKPLHLSLGLGIRTERWKIDYALLPYSELGVAHRISLSYNFGPSEEEVTKELYLNKMKALSESFYHQGASAFERESYDEAINYFENCLICDPTNQKALEKLKEAKNRKREKEIEKHYTLGKEYYEKGNYIEAARELKKVLDLDSTHPSAKFFLKLAKKKSSESLKEDYKVKFNKGLDYYVKEEYKKAEDTWKGMLGSPIGQEELAQAITLAKIKRREKVDSLLSEASLLFSQGQYKFSLSKYKKVKKLEPENTTALKKIEEIKSLLQTKEREYFQKGVELFQKGKLSQSKEEFEKVISINPDNSQARTYIRRIKARKKISRKELENKYMRATTAYLQNDLETAVRLWREIIEVDPEFENVKFYLQIAEEKLAKIKKKE